MSHMLTAKDVQTILEVDRSTVYRMAEAGRLPAIKVGRQWRFPADQVEQWLVAQNAAVVVDTAVPASRRSEALVEQIPLDCVQIIQDTYAKALGVMIIITDMKGQPVTQLSNPCGLFEALQDTPQLWQKCIAHWQEMAAGLSLKPRFMEGYLGLLCSRAYIRTGVELKGMVFVGGIAPEKWPLPAATLHHLAADLSVDFDLLNENAAAVYFLDKTQQDHVLSLVQPIADVVSHILHERHSLLQKLDALTAATAV